LADDVFKGILIVKAFSGESATKREQLIKNIKRAVKAYQFRHQMGTQQKLLRQQQEMIDLKRRELELKTAPVDIQGVEVPP